MELNAISHSSRLKTSIQIRDAYKLYSPDAVILKGLNMTVPRGSIYALLGPSGCGKSTLLNCIVGRSKLNSGSIKLSVSSRSGIGFMPQTSCLQGSLTIYENAMIFGYLFGKDKKVILARADKYLKLLDLPSGDRFFNSLSGGQQRRVSIVVTLIHDPEILLLDEPAVGLDIVLVQIVWDYFIYLAGIGKTLIITTHCMEETLKANTVAFMRNGILLVEENPRMLMEHYGCSEVEEAFLLIIKNQETITNDKDSVDYSSMAMHSSSNVFYIDDITIFSKQRMKAILYKNCLQLMRNHVFIAMTIFLPVIQICIYHSTYGALPEKVHVGVINDEMPLDKCHSSLYAGCFLNSSQSNTYLSCLFIDMMRNKTYKIIRYNHTDEAVDDVKENKIWAAFHFHQNYTSSLVELTSIDNSTNTTKFDEKIDVWVDLSSLYIGVFVKNDLQEVAAMHLMTAYAKCGLEPNHQQYPLFGINFKEPLNVVTKEGETGLMSTIVPAMILLFSLSLSCYGVSMEGTQEKLEGTIVRMQIAGLSRYEYLSSFVFIHLFLHIFRIIFIFGVLFWAYGHVHRGSLLALYVLCFIVGAAGIILGMLIVAVSSSSTITVMAVNSVFFVITCVSGLLWPVEGQEQTLQDVNWIFPLKYAIPAAQGISVKDMSINDSVVLRGFYGITTWMIVFGFLLFLIVKYKPKTLIPDQ